MTLNGARMTNIRQRLSCRLVLITCAAMGLAWASTGQSQTGVSTLTSSPPPASTGALQAVYLGQDGHDYCMTDSELGPNDIQDLHLRVEGVPANEEIAAATFTRLGGGAWSYSKSPPRTRYFRAELRREPHATAADVFLEPTFDEAAFELHIELDYASDRKAGLDTHCGRSDPNRFMPQAILRAHWMGQEGHDLTGPTPAVGPDGFQDARLDLTGLSQRLQIQTLRLEAGGAGRWECGANRDRLANAELAWDPQDASKASLFFSPTSDLRDGRLTLTIQYANGRHQSVEVTAGKTDPDLAMARPPEIPIHAVLSQSLSVKWLGQESQGPGGRGDVHLVLEGIPKDAVIRAAAVSDPYGGYWVFCLPEAEAAFYGPPAKGALRTLDNPSERDKFGLLRLGPYEELRSSAQARFGPLPLSLQRRPDNLAADLWMPPFRDETGARLTLRVLLRTGQGKTDMAICSFPGQQCDPYCRGPVPAETSTTARPGDDLKELANRFGHVTLSPGRYTLKAPLTLEHPVIISGSRDAILEFSQAPSSPGWSEAVRISAGNTMLEGFRLRFAKPVRWQAANGDATVFRAVPRQVDGSGRPNPIVNLVVKGLDLESAPIEPVPEPGHEQPSIFMIRFGAATSGRILNNIIRGGTIDVMNGPWEISGNTYRGTMPGTVAWDVFGAHYVHDLAITRNRLAPAAPCGKTWRFLVVTQRGERVSVSDNWVENIGMKDDDKLANPNAPEIMLTESYRLNYEGRPARISAGGWIVQIPLVLYWHVEPGCVLSILSGPSAARWFRIAQPLSPTAFLLEQPLPEALWLGDYTISIAHGFTDLAWERNTIDARGGRSALIVLAGNHWNTRLAENHLLGGGEAMRLGAEATERPGPWGWSHTPMFDLMLARNLCEDSRSGIGINVCGDNPAKTIAGRTYLTGVLQDNIIRWSEPFVAPFRSSAQGQSTQPRSYAIGSSSGPDARQMRLRLMGNKLEAPPGFGTGGAVSAKNAIVEGR